MNKKIPLLEIILNLERGKILAITFTVILARTV